MSTKANWDGLHIAGGCDEALRIFDGASEAVCRVTGDSKAETESRARQICALPEMVSFLKRMMIFNSISDKQHALECKAILREIGEVE